MKRVLVLVLLAVSVVLVVVVTASARHEHRASHKIKVVEHATTDQGPSGLVVVGVPGFNDGNR